MPKVMTEVFSIPIGADRYLLYAPLRQSALVANGRLVNLFNDLREGSCDTTSPENAALVQLLRSVKFVDAGAETAPISTFVGPPRPTTVTLFMTTACNLRCTYCYASAGDTPLKTMPLEIAKRGIRFVAKNAKTLGRSHFEVAYHGGGEPSLNWDVMKTSHAYAQDLARGMNLQFSSAAASNGMLSHDQTEWMIRNLDGVSLSFDGLPETHDRHRLTVMGRASSPTVIKTMRRFDAAGFAYGVRMTVTRDQIAQLPESVTFVCSQFKPQRVQVEPAYQLGRWSDAPSAETQEFIDAFREARARARAHGHDLAFSGARVGLLTSHFCGVTQDNFALSPDGNVSGCYEVFSEDDKLASTFFYGRPASETDEYEFDLERLGALRSQSVENREFCKGCFAKWHCAGDCLNKAYTANGTTEFSGTERCQITRELTKDQILDRIAAAGGLFWHEGLGKEGVGDNRA